MKGSSVPQKTVYHGGYQLAYYEGREQPYTIWTMPTSTVPKQYVLKFVASRQEAEQWVDRHPRAN